MRASRYCILLGALVMGSLAAIAAMNLALDPYQLARSTSASERTAVTERQGAFLRAAFDARARMPRTVILGTSRAYGALRSDHPAFESGDAPVLNLALAASSIDQIRLLLIHAHTVSGVRKAVVGLDLESFLGVSRPDFDPAALAGNRETEPTWMTQARVALARDTVVSSVQQALLNPNEPARMSYDDELKELGGVRGMFWITEINNFYARLPDLFPLPRAQRESRNDPRLRDSMDAFRRMLRYAHANGIDLRLFISPVHARYLEWYRRVGWWPMFEVWKRELVEAIAAEQSAHAGVRAYPLWDLSGYHAFALESVPKLNDLAKRMTWYRESSHYSIALGDLILARVLGSSTGENILPDGRIDVGNVEDHLKHIEIDGEQYRQTQAWEATNVREMVTYLRRVARK